MKKTIVGMFLALVTAIALAMPSPKQIESAIADHDYASAKSMTAEVLRERPNSARAHLLNAYILLKQGNKAAASEELENVNRLDKEPRDPASVRGSALYGRTVAELQMPTAAVTHRTATYAPVQRLDDVSVKTQSPGFLHYVIIAAMLGLVGYAVVLLLTRLLTPRPEPVVIRSSLYTGSRATDTDDTTYVRQPQSRDEPRFRASRPVYDTPAQPVQQPVAQQQPMGMMGTAGSVAGGVVAGNLISDMLHSGHRSHRSDDDEYETRRRRQRESDSYSATSYDPTPSYSAPVSSESSRSSYSSGSDDSWGSSSSSSSSSDSWGSSDSSSSSSDGGGSWD